MKKFAIYIFIKLTKSNISYAAVLNLECEGSRANRAARSLAREACQGGSDDRGWVILSIGRGCISLWRDIRFREKQFAIRRANPVNELRPRNSDGALVSISRRDTSVVVDTRTRQRRSLHLGGRSLFTLKNFQPINKMRIIRRIRGDSVAVPTATTGLRELPHSANTRLFIGRFAIFGIGSRGHSRYTPLPWSVHVHGPNMEYALETIACRWTSEKIK